MWKEQKVKLYCIFWSENIELEFKLLQWFVTRQVMTGLLSLLSFHYCAALSSGDWGQRANVWFLAHVHCHCIESRPQEWRRCRRRSAEAFQRGTVHNNTLKKRLGLFRRVQLKSGCDVICVVCFHSFILHEYTLRCCSQQPQVRL